MKRFLMALVCFLVILPVVWTVSIRFEGGRPSIELSPPLSSINRSQDFVVSVADDGSGLRRIWMGLFQDGKEIVLLEEEYDGSENVYKQSFKIKVEPRKMGLTDGKAILRMVVRDYSWRRWFHGNRTYIERPVMIDTRPPEIDILTRAHNINQGGAGLVIYRISESCPESGVYVGGNYFPGHTGYFDDNQVMMAFFALKYDQKADTEIYVQATDQAGNNAGAGFYYHIREKSFKKDILNISDRFLNQKMPEFEAEIKEDPKMSMKEKFLAVNRGLREANYRETIKLGEETDNVLYWSGVFLRLPKSAQKAGFADRRAYRYNGSIIDQQIHTGVDLASVAHSSVPASNRGKVAFVGRLGIYGRTVLLDHGFGLFSMYSHLSRIDVQSGQIIKKGEILGETGVTGLAGGDHLHFGMLVHNVFVNPVEWWDAAWIRNNVSAKIDAVKSGLQNGP